MRSDKIANFLLILMMIYYVFVFLLIFILFNPSLQTKIIYLTPVFLLSSLFWIRSNLRINITLGLVTIGLCIFFLNLGLNVGGDFLDRPPAAKKASSFNKRTALEMMDDFEKKGKKIFPFFRTSDVLTGLSPVPILEGQEALILGQISDRELLFCNEDFVWLFTKTDKFGFNNDNSVYQKPVDLAVVGDSYVYGECVQKEENFVNRLKDGEKIKNVINFGMGDMGPLRQFAVVMEYVRYFKPKYLLWFYNEGNDFHDLDNERKFAYLTNYLFENDYSVNLMGKQKQINEWLETEIERRRVRGKKKVLKRRLIQIVLLTDLKEFIKNKFYSMVGNVDLWHGHIPDVVMYQKILKKTKELVSEWSGQVIFIYNPNTYYRKQETRFDGQPPKREVLRLAQELDIPTIDLAPTLQRYDVASIYSLRKGHYNKQGYQIIAEEIQKQLSLLEP